MKVKVWGIIQGPTSIDEAEIEFPEGANYFMVCKAEVDGVLGEDNFWFEDFNDAYEWETYFKTNIDPIVIDMDHDYPYN